MLQLLHPPASHAAASVCSQCPVRAQCLPPGLDTSATLRLEVELVSRRKLKRGDFLYRHGEQASHIYVVHGGFMKTQVSNADARHHVQGFWMAGEYLGLDAWVQGRYSADAIALEDTEVCAWSLPRWQAQASSWPALATQVQQLLGQEMLRSMALAQLRSLLRAEARLALFLLDLAQRHALRGYSDTQLVLRMNREDLGRFLGLTLETVCRTFTKLAQDGVLAVDGRHIQLLDAAALQALLPGVGQPQPTHRPRVARACAV